MIIRPAILSIFLFVGLWAIAALVPWDLPRGVTRAEVAACHESPHPDCLFDLGIALLHDEREIASSHRWLAHLSMSGRIEDAEAVLLRQAERDGASPDEALKAAQRATAHFQLIRDLSSGVGLDAALANVPEANGGNLWLVGLHLLGRKPFGPLFSLELEATGDAERELVAGLATRILAWNRATPPRARDFHLAYAAELRAALGDQEGVAETIRAMSARDLRLTSPSKELVEVAGPEAVLALADPADNYFAHLLQLAGSAEQDPTRAAKHLARAFEIHARRSTWPDFDMMLRVVGAAADRGLAQEVRAFADRMVELAESYADAPFGVFHSLDAAEALNLAGATPEAVSRQIAFAVSQFPESSSEVVAVGLVSSPMRWESFGLADEARRRVAAISAEIGDHETAVTMLGRLNEPVSQWLYLAHLDLPVGTLDVLHEAAWRLLPPEDAAYVTGQIARMVVAYGRTVDHETWALRTVRELAADPDTLKARSGSVATAVAVVAFDQRDDALGRAALEALARLALDRRDAALLVRAGYMMRSAQP